jgi:hypothetical protein
LYSNLYKLSAFTDCGGGALAAAFLLDLRKPGPGDFSASQTDKSANGRGQKPCGDEKIPLGDPSNLGNWFSEGNKGKVENGA